jgi:hypothetical protein
VPQGSARGIVVDVEVVVEVVDVVVVVVVA